MTTARWIRPTIFTAALHPKLTPLITGAAVTMALAGQKNLPRVSHSGLRHDGKFRRRPYRTHQEQQRERRRNEIIADVALPLMAAADNPFAYVPMTEADGDDSCFGYAVRSAKFFR